MITYVLPYYRAPKMLSEHLCMWALYAEDVHELMRLLIVDDGSPEPAEPIVRKHLAKFPALPISLYRIKQDIPWNRNGARNLGSHIAQTPWLLHTDIDHILPHIEARLLISSTLDHKRWYRFKRYRVGAADSTRRKDKLPDDQEFGEIKPHGDSYLCTRSLYWKVGGYDEDYSGNLGGGTPFLEQMTAESQPEVLPIALHVYTRSAVSDASVETLSRDTSAYSKLRAEKAKSGQIKARNPLRFDWSRVI